MILKCLTGYKILIMSPLPGTPFLRLYCIWNPSDREIWITIYKKKTLSISAIRVALSTDINTKILKYDVTDRIL